MIPRLHIDGPLAPGADIALPPEASRYLISVLRREAGATVRAFNPSDGEFEAKIAAVGKRGVGLRLGACIRLPMSEPDIWLVFAVVKRAAVETIVQKATELGVARLLPVITARTNADRLRLDRLAAIAREAAEQCGRLSIPTIEPPQRLDALIAGWVSGRRLFFCDETGAPSDDPSAIEATAEPMQSWGGVAGRAAPLAEALRAAGPVPAAVLIGPEGGFAPPEIDGLRSRAFVVSASLGPRILRADTAAIAALSIWQAVRGDWRDSRPD